MDAARWLAGVAMLGVSSTAWAGSPPSDRIDHPLSADAPDPARGRAIVASRQKGLCLLCHQAPIPEERFQGNIGPDLSGVGARLSAAQIRLRLVDPARLNPDSVMPSYHRIEHLRQVAKAWRGLPILDAREIEDVVAYLSALRPPMHPEPRP